MSYIATLASCLTGRLQPNDSFITFSGSCHGADRYFPVDFDSPRIDNYRPVPPSDEEWKVWHQKAIEDYSNDGLVIIKEGWQKYGADKWQLMLNDVNSLSVISRMDDYVNLFYCWYNMVDKIPSHVYRRLREKSRLWPNLWWKVTKKMRVHEMCMAMPLYEMGTAPNPSKPNLMINSTDVIKDNFPTILCDFLNNNNINAQVNNEILTFHSKFSIRQQNNLEKAKLLASGNHRWKPMGKFDLILNDWYDRTFLDHSDLRLAYLNNRTAYLRKD